MERGVPDVLPASATSSRTSSLASPRCSGGSVAPSSGDRVNRVRGFIGHAVSRSAARYRPLAGRSSSSRSSAGTTVCGVGAVGDVLAGKGGLVHRGAHVAGIEGVYPQIRVLDGENGGEVVQGGFRRAVPTPAGVGLDRGVGAEHDDGRGRCRRSAGSATWVSASGAITSTS